ncbi:DNA topoisomerase [Heyndrickxia camelliae]|uniref:DNA topoisomerase n=1 Tax=Heyndrickxia camelliae TaxID=1707093 RepID=A0A2N3LEG7_9BACI|nr:DNA topoisomerase [Heyndrickxia camelliae]PKR83040.1 DNA topoisomerase III [Heyndrickxia camelliae]
MELFVCEKPYVARELATAISKGYESKEGYCEGKDGKIYTYAFGHLVSCVMPEEINREWGWKGDISSLPFFIQDIPLKVIDDPGIKKQYNTIVKLMKEASIIYIATDAGREGEHIFRKIYELSGVKKPLKRLWIQDMTNEGINKAFKNSKDGKMYEGLALAGKLREESDLLVGLNATQLVTRLSGSSNVLSFGRVQTPTLSMVVNRDKQIENFSKTVHYSICAKDKYGSKFELVLDKDNYLTKQQAEYIKNLLGNRTNLNVSTQNKKEKPEKLFDLTELQKFMNEKYKWSADKTLNITQKLYEKKYVTYPRTSSQYIANDSELPQLLQKHSSHEWVKTIIDNGYDIEKSFVNPEKVTDHEAIIITSKVAENISGDEKTLYEVIFTRFIAAFYPPAIKEEVTAIFNDGEYKFQAKETALIELGWRLLIGDELQESTLKNIGLRDVGEYFIVEKETKPPKRYTEATLLHDMKHAGKFLDDAEDRKLLKSVEGIGTVATRASIIETLVKRGYIEKKGNNLISTPLGREIIGMMPDSFSLYSVKLTAFFETLLSEIERGEINKQVFYNELEGLIKTISSEIRSHTKKVSVPTKEVIALCPKCGKEMYENTKSYYCSGYSEGCKVSLWKNGLEKLGKKTITKKEANKLLSGKVISVKLKSKAGNPYSKNVIFNKEKGWVEFAK